jgi:Ser/Thr protein kinase RdoA (MazF antagonist)
MTVDHPSAQDFPVLRSKIAVESLADTIEARYAVKVLHCHLIKGTIRDTYFVATPAKSYVFCLYGHRHREEVAIDAEIRLLTQLAHGGLRVPTAIPTMDGEWLLRFAAPEGMRFGVLFSHLPGKSLARQPDAHQAERVGRALATLHVAMDTLPNLLHRPVIDIDALVRRPLAAFGAVGYRPDALSVLQDAAATLLPLLQRLPVSSSGHGMVHGDVIPSNLLVMPDDGLAFVDFDCCGYGWRVTDLGAFLGELRFWNALPLTADAFVAGYEQVRSLAPWEHQALPVFESLAILQALGIPAARINEWGSAALADEYIDTLLGHLNHVLTNVV